MGTQVSSKKREICFSRGAWAAVYMCEPFAEHRNQSSKYEFTPYYDDGIFPEEVRKADLVAPSSLDEYKKYCDLLGRPHAYDRLDENDFRQVREFIRDVARDGDGFSVSY